MSKTIFITGASTGIGAATARAAIDSGWRVGLFARSKDKLADLAADLGANAMILPGDVTQVSDVTAAADTMVQEWVVGQFET